MRIIHREALVPYSPEQMFALVHDVAQYSSFLPWCVEAIVLVDKQKERIARVGFAKGILRKSFTTRNVYEEGRAIHIFLVEGPFKTLTGAWLFSPVGTGSKISFNLHCEFSTSVLEVMAGPVFHQIADTFVQAFCQRAEVVYGLS